MFIPYELAALQTGVQALQQTASQLYKLDQRLIELSRIPSSRVSEGLTPYILQLRGLGHAQLIS
jgi:hypothetical protein